MLDWVLNTPLSIALSLEKIVKWNLATFNRRPHNVLRRYSQGPANFYQNTSTKGWFETSLGCQIKNSLRHQIETSPGCLGDVLEVLEGNVLGTFWAILVTFADRDLFTTSFNLSRRPQDVWGTFWGCWRGTSSEHSGQYWSYLPTRIYSPHHSIY